MRRLDWRAGTHPKCANQRTGANLMFPGGPTLARSAMRQRSFIILAAALAALAGCVVRRLNRPAQDASLEFSSGSVTHGKARKGRLAKAAALRAGVEHGPSLLTRDHSVPISVTTTKPKVTTGQLAAKY